VAGHTLSGQQDDCAPPAPILKGSAQRMAGAIGQVGPHRWSGSRSRTAVSRGRAPRYALLAESIAEDIRKGRYAVGSMLPTEADLCQQFGVSRHTVREALRKLGDLGMLSRHQGIGTRVKARQGSSRFVQSIGKLSDLFAYIEDTRLVIASRQDIRATPAKQRLLRCAPGQRWRMLEVLRYSAGSALPMVVSEIYLPQAHAAVESEMRDLQVPIYTLIERRYGERIAEVQQEIDACALSADKARLLGVRAGSAGLAITRHYFGENDKLLLVSASLYPAGRFTSTMRLRASAHDPATP
jgi:DNA-binding GntR family transcriptional regulator